MSMIYRLRALILMVMMVAMLAFGGSASAHMPTRGGGGSGTPTPPCPAPWTQVGGTCVKIGITVGSSAPPSGPQVSTRYLGQ